MNRENFYLKVLNLISNVISDENYNGGWLDFRVHNCETDVEVFGIHEIDLMFDYISQLPSDTEWEAVLYINGEDEAEESGEYFTNDFDK